MSFNLKLLDLSVSLLKMSPITDINIQIDAYKETKNVERLLACTARFTFVSVKKLQDGSYEKVAHDKNH